MTPEAFFVKQLNILMKAVCNNCYIMEDFNLDAKMSNRTNYTRKAPLLLLIILQLKTNWFKLLTFLHGPAT